MVLTHYSSPQMAIWVVHGGASYQLQNSCVQLELTMRENAVDTAKLVLGDELNIYYDGTISHDDPLRIFINYAEVSSPLTTTDLRFNGFVEELSPSYTKNGELLNITARAYSRGLLAEKCAQQYGSESLNPSLDTLAEILEDATYGMFPKYLEHVLNTATHTGYALTTTSGGHTTIDPALNDVYKYFYFPYEPIKNCLDDLSDVTSAIKGSAAPGFHWIVRTLEAPAGTFTNYFVMSEVGHHDTHAEIEALWPTWWNTDEADSTITVKQDMIVQNFQATRPEANYVIYHGVLRKPGDGDLWTENNHGLWEENNGTASDEDTIVKVGSYSLQFDPNTIAGSWINYPSSKDASWDVTKWGGRYNIPNLSFWVHNDTGMPFSVFLYSGALGYFQLSSLLNPTADTWQRYDIPIGPYSRSGDGVWWVPTVVTGTPVWTDIDFITFIFYNDTGSVYLDGVCFNGHVIRAARKRTAASATEPYCSQKLITDDVGKDDSGKADDTYTMARLAKAELLRCSRRAIFGEIQIPGKPTILPGQKAHILAAQYSGGYRIHKTMRITQHRLIFNSPGLTSVLSLTDDLINGLPLSPMNSFNLIAKATNPEFQNRQIASIKTRDIDITQPILEVTYDFNDYY